MLKQLNQLRFYLFRGIHTFISYWSGYRIAPKPTVMYVEVTYRCTCKCGFCERWKVGPKMSKQELTTQELKKVLKDAYQIGVRFIGFTGGEAFLRKDIFELGEFAKKLGFNITVASNGTLINEKNVKKIAEIFDSVTISMDGVEEKTHDLIRGVKGVYQKAIRALSLLQENNVPVAINMVITTKNYLQIDNYINFFSQREKPIPIQLTPVHDYETSFLKVKKELKKIDLTKFNQVWSGLSQKHSFLNNFFYKYVPVFFADPKKLLNKYNCFAGSSMFFLNPFGDVFPCEFNRISMGNVKKESLINIWRKGSVLRRNISSSKRSCICWTHCVVPQNNKLTKFICLKNNN